MQIRWQRKIKRKENKIIKSFYHKKLKKKKDNGSMNIINVINKVNVKLDGIKDNDCL